MMISCWTLCLLVPPVLMQAMLLTTAFACCMAPGA